MRASCQSPWATWQGRPARRARRAGRVPGFGTDSESSERRARRRQGVMRRAREKTAGTYVVRLLTGSRLADLETPEGGTRSSSHRATGLQTRALTESTNSLAILGSHT